MKTFVDINKFLNGLKEGQAKAIAAAKVGLDLAGEQVIGRAQEITPVATGALAASGTTEPAKFSGGTLTKVIGFNTSYALPVHENLDAHHEAPGQAKFLERAIRDAVDTVPAFVAGEIRKAL